MKANIAWNIAFLKPNHSNYHIIVSLWFIMTKATANMIRKPVAWNAWRNIWRSCRHAQEHNQCGTQWAKHTWIKLNRYDCKFATKEKCVSVITWNLAYPRKDGSTQGRTKLDLHLLGWMPLPSAVDSTALFQRMSALTQNPLLTGTWRCSKSSLSGSIAAIKQRILHDTWCSRIQRPLLSSRVNDLMRNDSSWETSTNRIAPSLTPPAPVLDNSKGQSSGFRPVAERIEAPPEVQHLVIHVHPAPRWQRGR
jgi:hypothetical protein